MSDQRPIVFGDDRDDDLDTRWENAKAYAVAHGAIDDNEAVNFADNTAGSDDTTIPKAWAAWRETNR